MGGGQTHRTTEALMNQCSELDARVETQVQEPRHGTGLAQRRARTPLTLRRRPGIVVVGERGGEERRREGSAIVVSGLLTTNAPLARGFVIEPNV